MIHNHKLQELDEDEYSTFLYIINGGEEGGYKFDKLCYLQKPFIAAELNNYLDKIKPEYKYLLDSIAEKLLNVKVVSESDVINSE